jgi:hypothetical protein
MTDWWVEITDSIGLTTLVSPASPHAVDEPSLLASPL